MTKLEFLELVTETIGSSTLTSKTDCYNIVTHVADEYTELDALASSTYSAMGLNDGDVFIWKAWDEDNDEHIMLFVRSTEGYVYYGELEKVPMKKYFGMLLKIKTGLYNLSDVAATNKILNIVQSVITAALTSESFIYDHLDIIADMIIDAFSDMIASFASSIVSDNITMISI